MHKQMSAAQILCDSGVFLQFSRVWGQPERRGPLKDHFLYRSGAGKDSLRDLNVSNRQADKQTSHEISLFLEAGCCPPALINEKKGQLKVDAPSTAELYSP